MYMYTYMIFYICAYIRRDMYTFIYAYIYIDICRYVRIYICICIYICVRPVAYANGYLLTAVALTWDTKSGCTCVLGRGLFAGVSGSPAVALPAGLYVHACGPLHTGCGVVCAALLLLGVSCVVVFFLVSAAMRVCGLPLASCANVVSRTFAFAASSGALCVVEASRSRVGVLGAVLTGSLHVCMHVYAYVNRYIYIYVCV